ncbi:MAG: 50S ribosomal protein L18 [Candidatus Nanoarchaeia archaeon]|nr:50S ribosomal protein L18 [Candidatus Nanoarchaeia archaeon]MDD5741729.1 50S ribosomal protein L18 [Candidatus Nanoarchaeia archaeon]
MRLNKKRRIQGKTNYRKRLILLKGNLPRLVVRKTNRHIIIQIVESRNAKDKVLSSVITKDLSKYGWPDSKKGSLKSITACYLGGFLIGKKSKVKKVILDAGLIPNTKGSRVYAVVKGILDSGIEINCDENVFPSEEKIKEHEGIDLKSILEKINKTGNVKNEVKSSNKPPKNKNKEDKNR